jgi:hypothetical protein
MYPVEDSMAARVSIVSLLALIVCLAGCKEDVGLVASPDDLPGLPGDEQPAVEPGPEPLRPTHPPAVFRITVESAQPLLVPADGAVPLTVRVTADEAGVPGNRVDFLLIGPETGITLATDHAFTDAVGRAHVVVQADWIAAVDGQILATHHQAGEVVADLRVDVPGAALDVSVLYGSQAHLPVERVSVSVHESGVGCDVLDHAALPAGLAEGDLHDLAETLRFEDLPGNAEVTLLAVGWAAGEVRATGCTTGVWLEGAEENEATLVLVPGDLDPTGTYDLAQSYDLGELVSGDLGGAFWTLVDFANDPAEFIVDAIEDWLDYDFGFFRPLVVDLVADALDDVISDSVQSFLDGLADTGGLFRNLGVDSTVDIDSEAGALTATERWDALTFTWRGGCDPGISPGCDRRTVVLDGVNLDPVETTYAVTVDEDGVLAAPAHTLQVPIAALYRIVLTELVYPSQGDGATTTVDLLDAVVNCQGIAEDLDASDGVVDGRWSVDLGFTTVHFSNNDIRNSCREYVLKPFADIIDGEIDAILGDTHQQMTRTGGATLVDDTANRRPDRIVEGSWSGDVLMNATHHPMTGEFQGWRRAAVGP